MKCLYCVLSVSRGLRAWFLLELIFRLLHFDSISNNNRIRIIYTQIRPIWLRSSQASEWVKKCQGLSDVAAVIYHCFNFVPRENTVVTLDRYTIVNLADLVLKHFSKYGCSFVSTSPSFLSTTENIEPRWRQLYANQVATLW